MKGKVRAVGSDLPCLLRRDSRVQRVKEWPSQRQIQINLISNDSTGRNCLFSSFSPVALVT